MKIAYLGIDLMYSTLDVLSANGCEIIKIFTCPCDNITEFNHKVTAFAVDRGIEYTEDRITARDLEELAMAGCELLLCAGYYYRTPITADFPMVNIHPAPLPECRGAWPMPCILLGAFPYGGVAIHKMTEDFDTGDILMQEYFTVDAEMTLTDYMNKVEKLLPGMVSRLINKPLYYLKNAKQQGNGRYLPNPKEKDFTVTSDMSVAEAGKILRAFYGYECIYKDGQKQYELIGGRAFYSDEAETEKEQLFKIQGGYIIAERVKELQDTV